MAASPLMELVSPKVGIIREVAPQARGGAEPVPPYLYTAQLSQFDFRVMEKSERIGAGKGRTESEAIASAIGEAVERYCAYQWDPSRTFVARRKDVPLPTISPTDLVLYSEAQYRQSDRGLASWQESSETTWMEGVELPSGHAVAVPASLVYLVTPPPRPDDFFTPSSSNGLAAGPTLDQAVLGGLCELIERDALLIAWMNRLPAIEIDLAASGGTARAMAHHFASYAVQVRAFMLPTDLPAATVLALSLESDPGRPAQVVGMGCHVDPNVALVKALFEMCQGRPSEAKRFAEKPPRGRLVRYEDVTTLDDHSAFASLPENRHEFAFLWATGEQRPIQAFDNPSRGDVATDLAICVAGLTRAGCRVAYVDLTLPDVAQYPIHVVRTLVTALQPVHFGYDAVRLGGRRLFEVPQKLGFGDRPRTLDELKRCPHPLA